MHESSGDRENVSGVGNYCYVASARRRARRWGAHGDERGGAYRVATRTACYVDRVISYISLQHARMVAARYEFIVFYLSLVTICWIFSGTQDLSCSHRFWTAGQRIDPSSNASFIWQVKSTDTNCETVSQMSYTNWYPGEPNYGGQSCVQLYSNFYSCKWDDYYCSVASCSLCELDI